MCNKKETKEQGSSQNISIIINNDNKFSKFVFLQLSNYRPINIANSKNFLKSKVVTNFETSLYCFLKVYSTDNKISENIELKTI